MPNSQFNSPAALHEDGTVEVSGKLEAAARAQGVEFRFLIVQNRVVVEGTGQETDQGWSGTTLPGQGQLATGSALAIGLAYFARKQPEWGLGYETFTWSSQIELKRP